MTLPFPAMVFAAGFGTRMGDLTKHRPKPLIPVAGKPLIDHALELVADAPIVVVNTHYLGDQIISYLSGRGLEFSHESPKVLDTGGGLKVALPMLGAETVITLNSDAVWSGPSPVELLVDAWDPDRMDALAITVPLDHAIGRQGAGDFTADDQGRLTRGPDVVYGGAQIIKTAGLAGISDRVFSLNRLWDDMLAQGRMFGLTYPGYWCDVGHPEGVELAQNMLKGDV
ncbi:nucleotidyltransferase family protein [Chachezhania antarctica]|uniref:nucleotidyltransferase family protein n=1 Tax=Chachezhania antarctica TaxID=2340860 RepID=UPI001F08FAAF|nr:nucleotidyltransferase family protein [Chachezhania antarctica]|tara:strand:+ start:1576 stop:2256 length:681 start_codon:yes stop_codon:yes gene_type:complete